MMRYTPSACISRTCRPFVRPREPQYFFPILQISKAQRNTDDDVQLLSFRYWLQASTRYITFTRIHPHQQQGPLSAASSSMRVAACRTYSGATAYQRMCTLQRPSGVAEPGLQARLRESIQQEKNRCSVKSLAFLLDII